MGTAFISKNNANYEMSLDNALIDPYRIISECGQELAREQVVEGFWTGIWDNFRADDSTAWKRVYGDHEGKGVYPGINALNDLALAMSRKLTLDELKFWNEIYREELYSWRRSYKVEIEKDYLALNWWSCALRDGSEWVGRLLSAIREDKAFVINEDDRVEFEYWGSKFSGWAKGPEHAKCPVRIIEIQFLPRWEELKSTFETTISKSQVKSRDIPLVVHALGLAVLARSTFVCVLVTLVFFECCFKLLMKVL